MNNLIKLLEAEYQEEDLKNIIKGLEGKRYTTFRINNLKKQKEFVLQEFSQYGYILEEVVWYDLAYVIKNEGTKKIQDLESYKLGYIYVQSLSSMLPALLVEPMAQDCILDMCASPGSKTTLLASLASNKTSITAVEKNKIRYERLVYNLDKQGVTCVTTLNKDALKLDSFFRFNKILLDAPCSGSGTLNSKQSNYDLFTKNELTNIQRRQIALLEKALSLLNKNGVLIYATCSILKEENEEVLKKVAEKYPIEFLTFNINENIPLLPTEIAEVKCILPNQYFEGFFLAKLKLKA